MSEEGYLEGSIDPVFVWVHHAVVGTPCVKCVGEASVEDGDVFVVCVGKVSKCDVNASSAVGIDPLWVGKGGEVAGSKFECEVSVVIADVFWVDLVLFACYKGSANAGGELTWVVGVRGEGYLFWSIASWIEFGECGVVVVGEDGRWRGSWTCCFRDGIGRGAGSCASPVVCRKVVM